MSSPHSLDHYCEQGCKPYAVVLTLSPEQCQWLLLNRMRPNRPRSESKLAIYVDDMMNDRWAMNGSTLSFDDTGWCFDGQHRLESAVKTGRPLKTLIAFNLDHDSAMPTTDRGYIRRPGHVLDLTGYKGGKIVAAAAKYLAEIMRDQPRRLHKLWPRRPAGPLDSMQVLTEFCEANIEELERGMHLVRRYTRDLAHFCSPSLLAGVFAALAIEVDGDLAEEFIEDFILGRGEHNSSVMQARRRFLRVAGNVREKLSRRGKIALLVRAWNYWITGGSVRVLNIGGAKGTKRLDIPPVCGPDDKPQRRGSVAASLRHRQKKKKAAARR
ncbi:MAG: hypothetical protein ACYTAN_17585 [Planctomycetota bacterium]|jgi:hypothetical protein